MKDINEKTQAGESTVLYYPLLDMSKKKNQPKSRRLLQEVKTVGQSSW